MNGVKRQGQYGTRRTRAPVLGFRTRAASAGGSGVCVSTRDTCSWNAGTTQRPVALCIPDQLKEPSRLPHLQRSTS